MRGEASQLHKTTEHVVQPSPRETFAKLSGFPRSRGEMSEGQRGPLRDDQTKNAGDKSCANVRHSGESRNPGVRARGGAQMHPKRSGWVI